MTVVDIVVIAIIIISGVFAFVRGFVQETLSVVGWVGAAAATIYAFNDLNLIVLRYVENEPLAIGITIIGTFVITLVVLSLISHSIAVRVRASSVSAIDRTLGLLFGLARGAVVVVAAHLALEWALPREEQPEWLREARLMPYAIRGGEMAKELVPRSLRDEGVDAAERLGAQAREAIGEPEEPTGNGGSEGAGESESGYERGAREGMEFLLRNSGDR